MSVEFFLVVGGLLVLFSGVFIFGVVMDRRTLKLSIPLNSRKQINEADPDSYMLSLSEDKAALLASVLDPKSKQHNAQITWFYSTPAGRTTYSQTVKYSYEEIEGYVEKLKLIYGAGKDKVSGLNKLYKEQLKLGREVYDGNPKIYCYSIPSESHQGIVKVGYAKNNAHKRIEDQFKTAARLKIPYKIHFIMPAVTIDEKPFMDHPVHRVLKNAGVANPEGEWFTCSVRTAEQAVMAVQLNKTSL